MMPGQTSTLQVLVPQVSTSHNKQRKLFSHYSHHSHIILTSNLNLASLGATSVNLTQKPRKLFSHHETYSSTCFMEPFMVDIT